MKTIWTQIRLKGAVWSGFIMFHLMTKSSLKCTWIYVADVKSRGHFQDKYTLAGWGFQHYWNKTKTKNQHFLSCCKPHLVTGNHIQILLGVSSFFHFISSFLFVCFDALYFPVYNFLGWTSTKQQVYSLILDSDLSVGDSVGHSKPFVNQHLPLMQHITTSLKLTITLQRALWISFKLRSICTLQR